MDKRRDPTIARPKERRKSGDMSHDHVRCYNVRPWSHHVLRICEWRQQPWEPELSIATRSATAGICFSRKFYSITTVHLSCFRSMRLRTQCEKSIFASIDTFKVCLHICHECDPRIKFLHASPHFNSVHYIRHPRRSTSSHITHFRPSSLILCGNPSPKQTIDPNNNFSVSVQPHAPFHHTQSNAVKAMSSTTRITYATSFPMRGAKYG